MAAAMLQQEHDNRVVIVAGSSVEDKSFACEICWRRFARENDLKTHLWVHTQEKPFSCDLCHRAFPCLNSRNNHFKRTHKDMNLLSGSPMLATSQGSPQAQQQQQNSDQQLTVALPQQLQQSPEGSQQSRKTSPPCGICGKTFAFKYYVKIHQTVHTKEKPYICDLCHKTFSQASSRNRHRKEMHKDGSNEGELSSSNPMITDGSDKLISPFEMLGKAFPGGRGLALYEVQPVPHETSTKEKPYSCDLCHKRFTQASSRNRHLKEMHKEGERPLPPGLSSPSRKAVGVLTRNIGPACAVCGKRFPCKSLLEIHMRVHTKERPYSCEICFKTFTQVSSRNFHRRKMHKELVIASIPHSQQQQQDSSPDQQQQQGSHQQQQTSQQQLVKQAASTLADCSGKMVPQCGICGKRFPCKSLLEIHMRVHTKERPYSCDLCFKTFTQVSSRNFHRRKIHKDMMGIQEASPNQDNSQRAPPPPPTSAPPIMQQQQQPQQLQQQTSMVDDKNFHCKMCAAGGGFSYK